MITRTLKISVVVHFAHGYSVIKTLTIHSVPRDEKNGYLRKGSLLHFLHFFLGKIFGCSDFICGIPARTLKSSLESGTLADMSTEGNDGNTISVFFSFS
jgi:hypothetical protein